MATKYVNKSGNDGNSGDSAADAWLTIQHAVDNVAAGDTIYVQSGVYEENVSMPGTTLDLEADGYVIMDGSNIGGSGIGWYGGNFLVDGFYIQNYDTNVTGSWANRATFQNCIFKNGTVGHVRGASRFEKCIITGTRLYLNHKGTVYIQNSVLDNPSGDALYVNYYYSYGDISVKNCHLNGNAWFTDNPDLDLVSFDYNNIRGSITYKGTTYNTLSDFQNAYPDLAPHSINEDADFNPDYTLRWSSPNIGAGEDGVDIGARGPASYFESTDEIFEGANLTDVSRNANGDFELDGGATTGTVVSAVLDFGSDITLGNLRMESNEDYPADVIDSDVDDSEPNRANYEYRSATEAEGSFLQGDATPSWNEVERGDDLSLTCRYFQVRITLRSNGVAA